MKSNFQFSNNELIEETILQDASVKEIINWLKESFIQTQNNLNIPNDDFVELRNKYEPIWADKDARLKLAICSYGKNIKTLRKILFSNSSQNFKIAILKNHYFASHIKPYNDINLSSLTPQEIVNIYEKEKAEDNLNNGVFYYIFSNPWINEKTIFSLFNKEKEFEKINKYELQKIFSLMMLSIENKEINFFKINKDYDYEFIQFFNNLIELILEVDISKYPDFLYHLNDLLGIFRKNGYTNSFNINETKLEKFLYRRKINQSLPPEIIIMDHEVINNILNLIKVRDNPKVETKKSEILIQQETINKIFNQNKILINKNIEQEKKIEQLQNKLLEINTKVDLLEPKFDNIFDQVKKEGQAATNRYYNLHEKFDLPNDFFSKILFKIPILNQILKLLIK